MSVVAVKVYENKIVVAADSITMKILSKESNPNNFTKLRNSNGMIIGGCGESEEISLLWIYMDTHKPSSATVKEVTEFMVNFSKWKSEMGDIQIIRNDYILVFDKKAFYIEKLFIHELEDYAAIGAGYPFAITALHLGKSPVEAVDVTCKLCYLVSEPILEEIMLK